MRVIEVIISLFIIVAALTFANLLSISPITPTYEATELQKLGYNVLHDLDTQNLLPRFVYNGEWQNLTSALRVTLPLNVYFNLTIYRIQPTSVADLTYQNYVVQNNQSIEYGEKTAFSSSKNVASVTYGLVGCANQTSAQYDPRILVLQLVRG